MSSPNYLIAKRSRVRRLRGESAYVDAGTVGLHLAALLGAGWSVRSIAGEAGVAATTVSRVARGVQASVRPETAEALLSLRPDRVATTTNNVEAEPFVPRVGSVRRIQALLYMGWGHRWMREHSGVRTSCVLHQSGRWVTRSTHDAIAAMYRDLSHQRGPSSKASHYAHQRGYAGPLDWQDIDHDAEPLPAEETAGDDYLDEAAILRRLGGDKAVRLTPIEAAEVVSRWAATGKPLNECERVTGLPPWRYTDKGVAS